MTHDLRNQIALITGASRGIGKGIARTFADLGANVALVSREASAGETTSAELCAITGANVVFVGGDLAYNALQRLPHVIASNPQKVVVLIGANDVLAIASLKARRFYRISKRLLCGPSPEWFRTNLQAIAAQLRKTTNASVALCSLAPIGEDLASTNAFQSEINRRIMTLNKFIREVAVEEKADYLHVYETFAAGMENTVPHPFTEFRFLPFYRDALRTLVLRKSPDEVSRLNGWEFHTDGIHLNSRGGLIIADLVEKFVL